MSFTEVVTSKILAFGQIRRMAGLAIVVLLLDACKPNGPEPETNSPSEPVSTVEVKPSSVSSQFDLESARLVRQLVIEYLNQIENDFDDLGSQLSILQTTVGELISRPTAEILKESQEKWLAAHLSFQQNKIHFNFLSSIGSQAQSIEFAELLYRVDQWPIMAGYIDSVEGYPQGGIVHDVNVQIDPVSLAQQHGLFDSTEATLGFHVLEFLLWGEPSVAATQRTVEHFTPLTELNSSQIQSGMEVEQLGNNRRRQYSNLLSALLVEDFETASNLKEEVVSRFSGSIQDQQASGILEALLNAVTSTLNEEILTRSLYMLLNDDMASATPSPYSQTSDKAVASQLQSIEKLLLETPTQGGITLDRVLIDLSPNFEDFFYQNLDANKACLVLLYSNLDKAVQEKINAVEEFEVVECINLLTKLIDQLEQIKLDLAPFNRPV